MTLKRVKKRQPNGVFQTAILSVIDVKSQTNQHSHTRHPEGWIVGWTGKNGEVCFGSLEPKPSPEGPVNQTIE